MSNSVHPHATQSYLATDARVYITLSVPSGTDVVENTLWALLGDRNNAGF